jgi:hypothetical protein
MSGRLSHPRFRLDCICCGRDMQSGVAEVHICRECLDHIPKPLSGLDVDHLRDAAHDDFCNAQVQP